jgi:flagellar hook assembly protein FlgD
VLALAQKSSVRVEVLDLSGRVIRQLWDGTLGSGPHNFFWNGSDDDGREMPAGVYLVRAAVGSNHAMQRIVRLR